MMFFRLAFFQEQSAPQRFPFIDQRRTGGNSGLLRKPDCERHCLRSRPVVESCQEPLFCSGDGMADFGIFYKAFRHTAMDFDDFAEFFQLKTDSEMVSVSGWVMEQFGRVPEAGEEFEWNGLHVRVKSVEAHRIEQIEVRCAAAVKHG